MAGETILLGQNTENIYFNSIFQKENKKEKLPGKHARNIIEIFKNFDGVHAK